MIEENASPSAVGRADRLDVAVVGAGFGGMYAIFKFREMGLKVAGIEAAGDVGGVWYWNRYPGARCDLMSVDYSYSFSPEIEQAWTWSEQFADQSEILAYANFVADTLDLRRHIRFETRVSSAVWDETTKVWTITTDRGDTIEATYCVMATGPLSVPKDPDIPGLERFKGRLLRAQTWPHEPVGFAGKRVGVIGTGSSGIQIIQEVGREAGELFVLQRTPSYTLPMRNHDLDPDYVAEIKRNYPGMREAARNSPNGGVRPVSSRPFFSLVPSQREQIMEDAWQHGGHTFLGTFSDLLTNQQANDHVADFVRAKIGDIVKDPRTAEVLMPRGYPVFARRPCLDTEYYETYNLPNVHLVDCLTDAIEAITENGVLMRSGVIELDMLILATGYDALTGALLGFDIVGRDGRHLKQKWQNGSRSHLGLMIEGFPNLFMTCGPNGPAALANIITISEHDVDWIADLITRVADEGASSVEPSREAEDRWMELVQALAARTLVSKAKTWWVGANVEGKPVGLTMFTGGFHRYREHCAAASRDGYPDFVFERAQHQAAA